MFVDEVFKVLDAMSVNSHIKLEIAAYQLKNLSQVWYEQWKDERPVRECQNTWGLLKQLSLIVSFL